MYAVFCIPKNKSRVTDGPCLDPLDYGMDMEPQPHLLARRGRVGLFQSRELAEAALRGTLAGNPFPTFFRKHDFIVMECVQRASVALSEE